MGKLIYTPKGAAREYSQYAFNGFVGCSGLCRYCYNRKGITAKVLGANTPILRKCFKDIPDAVKKYKKELQKNLVEYQKHGIFFSFVGDPLSEKTKELTEKLIYENWLYGIESILLTKQIDWIKDFDFDLFETVDDKNISFGFTLTGIDELEKGCPSNLERIEALKILHKKGFNTWVSLEPVISFKKSLEMYRLSAPYVDVYKIGLESGKHYDKRDVKSFIENILYPDFKVKGAIIFKKSIQKYL